MPRSREITREKFNGMTAVKGIRWRNKEVRPGLTKYCKVLCIELYRILSPKIYRWFPQYTDMDFANIYENNLAFITIKLMFFIIHFIFHFKI